MPRIAGVNIPENKPLWISLTYIYGIGQQKAKEICAILKLSPTRRARELKEEEIARLHTILDKDHVVEGNLRQDVAMNIKRLQDLACYRGLRHRKKLPLRGQRTHTNARTRRGRAKTLAGKKQ